MQMQWQLIVKLSFETEKINEKILFGKTAYNLPHLSHWYRSCSTSRKRKSFPSFIIRVQMVWSLLCDVGQWTYPKVHICKMVIIIVPVL